MPFLCIIFEVYATIAIIFAKKKLLVKKPSISQKSTLVNNVGPCIFSEIQCHRIESHKSWNILDLTLDQHDLFEYISVCNDIWNLE